MSIDTASLDAPSLQRFQSLQSEAVHAVENRFHATHGAIYAQFGERGIQACREDLAFHLEFLRPALEFGIVQPMVDYLRWLASVLATRGIPTQHIPLSLDWLSEFFVANMAAPEAAIIVAALNNSKARFLEVDDAAPAIYEMMPEPWDDSEPFENALLAGDRPRATALLDSCFQQGHGLVDAELHMIQPALYSIGLKWQNNQVTVAQEHLATAIAQSVMTYGLIKSEVPASNGNTVLLACVEGNNHSVGLQMVADAFQLSGWEVQYLGANVPTNALLQHIGQRKPDLLGLSVSFAQQLRVVKEIISRLAQSYGAKRPSVIVGGLAINQFHRLAGKLGADGWSPDANAAIVSASRLAMPTRNKPDV